MTHTRTEGDGQVAAEDTAGDTFGSVGKISGAARASHWIKRTLVWRKTEPIVNTKCDKRSCYVWCLSLVCAVVCENEPMSADSGTRMHCCITQHDSRNLTPKTTPKQSSMGSVCAVLFTKPQAHTRFCGTRMHGGTAAHDLRA